LKRGAFSWYSCGVASENRSESSGLRRAKEVRWWILIVLFVLTLPLSFPLFLLYSKLSKWPLRGKGMAFLFVLWLIVTGVSSLLLAAYLKKGFDGVRTLFFVLVAGLLWAVVVFVAMRILLELFVWIYRLWGWVGKKLKK